jgi:hypothetical protein
MCTYVSRDNRSVTDPGVFSDDDSWVFTGLVSYRNVESISAMLPAAVNDRE